MLGEKEDLIDKLICKVIDIKRSRFLTISADKELKHNEYVSLFMLYRLNNNEGVLLSNFREKMNLAPSTITPVIAALESKGLIERVIDTKDRRNIFLKISPKGKEHMNSVYNNIYETLVDYIEYIGIKDVEKLIELLDKTQTFMSERRKINGEST